MRDRAAVAALLCAFLAGCEATAKPSASLILTSPTPVIAVGTASPTTSAVATPRPTPTPVPVLPKPIGVKLRFEETESECGDPPVPGDTCAIGDSIYTLSWKAPRTKGVEIRIYGVTTCFGEDSSGTKIDGHCLREHTALPSSIRVLLATARASKGKVTLRLDSGGGLAYPRHSKRVRSIVLAAYGAEGGHSIFVIADAGDRRHGALSTQYSP